ncbi:MAG: SH3 domain-containing protein, partial [Anaerolineae bacterium]|nr:SH3 domain-containing protein [Anaerolineae bacterium]
MQRTKVIFWIIILATILSPTLGSAQDATGLSVVQTVALDLASENCNQLSRNQACYGHDLLSADPQPGTNPFSFKSEGDIEDLEKIKSLRLDGLDLETGTWGIALLHLRANLPAERSGNVTLIAFGDVELQSAVKPPTEAEVQVSTSQYLNVRQTPSTDAGVIGALPPGQTVTAVERLED